MYFVITPEGRYGPVSRDVLLAWSKEGRLLPETVLEAQDTQRRFPAREYMWQQDGRTVALMVEHLPALPPERSGVISPPPSTPMAHPETTEFRVRVALTPDEAANGAERKVVLTGFSASGGEPPSVLKTVAIPPHIVTAANPRVRYRNRNQGLTRPDGTGTDLVLLVEFDGSGSPPLQTPLPSSPRPPYPEGSAGPAGTEEPPPPPPPPAVECPTEISMRIPRQLATTGGSLPVLLPSGRQRTVFLPPGVALRGRFGWVQMGETKPEGGNCDLRITFQIE